MAEKWTVIDDRNGDMLFAGSQEDAKRRYKELIASGEMAEMDLFIENDDTGDQFAWNSHNQEWEEL